MATSADRDALVAALTARLRDPGFTPGKRDLEGLLALVDTAEDDDVAKSAERALLRLDPQHHARALRRAIEQAKAAVRPGRGRLTLLVGRLVESNTDAVAAEAARAWLLEALQDADPKTRRGAARVLSKLAPEPRTAEALEAAWDAATLDDDKKVLAEALGRVGSRSARERLATEGAPVRAAIIAEREEARRHAATIAEDAALARPTPIRFFVRAGLEPILLAELDPSFGAQRTANGIVDATLPGAKPLAHATGARTALAFGFPLPLVTASGDLAADVATAVTSDDARAIFQTFTRDAGDRAPNANDAPEHEAAPIRFRVAFEGGKHRRSVAWKIAELVRARTKAIVNDPVASTWDVSVAETPRGVAVVLLPRGAGDARFAYRSSTVAASSHPTIAAAIARLAWDARTSDERPHDVVWDPFAGAGAELVERALLGPYAKLVGTDVAPEALVAARANLERAGVKDATLELADARTAGPTKVSVIVTNPPMGRRLERGGHTELLAAFVDRAAAVLEPGGLLVWTLPEAKRLAPRIESRGLVLERAYEVDLGGFTVSLSVHRKGPAPRRAQRKS